MSIFEWCESVYHRYRARKTVRTLRALPELHTVDQFSIWMKWIEEHKDQLTFNNYTPRLGHQIECRTRCNNIEELIEALTVLINGINNNRAIRYSEIPNLPIKESNLDYFLTDKTHRPLKIDIAFQRLKFEMDRLLKAINAIPNDSPQKTYFHSKANQLLDDLSVACIALIISSDLIGYRTIGDNR